MILPKDRDPRFITIRRGGTLTDSDHKLLALWAAACAEHVLHLFEAARLEGVKRIVFASSIFAKSFAPRCSRICLAIIQCPASPG